MKKYLLFYFSAAFLCLCLAGLVISPTEAATSAAISLRLCAGTIVPSLFPFMVVANMAVRLGLPSAAGKLLSPVSHKLFGISGAGLSAFILGLFGGYPLGAVTVSQLYSAKAVSRPEANRLLRFCNNCGPAFTISVTGAAVFGSAAAGYFIFGVHCVSAVLLAVLHRKKSAEIPVCHAQYRLDTAAAFTESVRISAVNCLSVCGFVTFFGVAVGLLDVSGFLPQLCGKISATIGSELHFVRSAAAGLLELGNGVGSMAGLSMNAKNLALASFILGWGSLSVQAQAAAAINESGLSAKPHFFGKLEHGVLAAVLTLLAYPIFF